MVKLYLQLNSRQSALLRATDKHKLTFKEFGLEDYLKHVLGTFRRIQHHDKALLSILTRKGIQGTTLNQFWDKGRQPQKIGTYYEADFEAKSHWNTKWNLLPEAHLHNIVRGAWHWAHIGREGKYTLLQAVDHIVLRTERNLSKKWVTTRLLSEIFVVAAALHFSLQHTKRFPIAKRRLVKDMIDTKTIVVAFGQGKVLYSTNIYEDPKNLERHDYITVLAHLPRDHTGPFYKGYVSEISGGKITLDPCWSIPNFDYINTYKEITEYARERILTINRRAKPSRQALPVDKVLRKGTYQALQLGMLNKIYREKLKCKIYVAAPGVPKPLEEKDRITKFTMHNKKLSGVHMQCKGYSTVIEPHAILGIKLA